MELNTEARAERRAKVVSNWLLGEFTRLLNATDTEIDNARVTPELLVDMLELIDNGTLGGTAAKTVFEEMFNSGRYASDIIAERELAQISDTSEIGEVVDRVIASNGQAVEDYKNGREQALQFLVGQVMRETKGRADYIVVNELIKERLVT
jgi:aspartyl-tRNA(Asn)/glutamyl-tRNA(Gln) amidotransferase subunit B